MVNDVAGTHPILLHLLQLLLLLRRVERGLGRVGTRRSIVAAARPRVGHKAASLHVAAQLKMKATFVSSLSYAIIKH